MVGSGLCRPRGARFLNRGLPSAEALGYLVAVPQRGTRSLFLLLLTGPGIRQAFGVR